MSAIQAGTLAKIQDLVPNRIGSGLTWETAHVQNLIMLAARAAWEQLGMNHGSERISLVAGQHEYTLDQKFISVDRVEFSTVGGQDPDYDGYLHPASLNVFDDLCPSWRELGAVRPELYTLVGTPGSPDAEIDNFIATHSVPEVSHVAMGTIWPRPKVFHVPATVTTLTELVRIMKHHAGPELAVHFHVYRNDSVLLQWHDAFSQPMLMSGAIPEEKVKVLTDKIGKNFRKIVEQVAAADADKPRR